MPYTCWGLVVLLAWCVQAVRADAPRPPNVVLYLVDDMGWMDSEPYGSQYYETPHMQRFAERSMRFTSAYACPLCSPTRASILTGQYSSRHGILTASGHQPPQAPDAPRYPAAGGRQPVILPISWNYLQPSAVTLAEVLRAAGYRTGHFGKWHLGLTQPHWPEQQGFEQAWHAAPDPGPPSYFSPYGVSPTGIPGGKNHVGTVTDGPDGEYIVDRLADEATAFIRQHRDEPFFLNFWQYGVHGPWGHREEYTAEFARKADPRGLQKNPIMGSMLKSVDQAFGRVLDTLDELQLTDNTIVIFFSDNGGNTHSNVPGTAKTEAAEKVRSEFLADWRKWAGNEPPTNNSPLREGKSKLYEGGIRVPLMIAWPGRIQPGTTSDAIVGAIDLYPTVLEMLNLERPAAHVVDGVSILPVLRQTGTIDREAYFTWFPSGGAAVRQGDWKLIRRFVPTADAPNGLELFHLGDDLSETRNLAEEQPERAQALNALIDRFAEETGALLPLPNPQAAPIEPTGNSAGNRAPRPLQGWVPKVSQAELRGGALRVTPGENGRTGFVAMTGMKVPGPARVRLTYQCAIDGAARMEWRTTTQEEFPASQSVSVSLPASEGTSWSEQTIELPVAGQLLHVRLYLPQTAEIAFQSIEIRSTTEPDSNRQWQFATAP